jgi:hypothetical protein
MPMASTGSISGRPGCCSRRRPNAASEPSSRAADDLTGAGTGAGLFHQRLAARRNAAAVRISPEGITSAASRFEPLSASWRSRVHIDHVGGCRGSTRDGRVRASISAISKTPGRSRGVRSGSQAMRRCRGSRGGNRRLVRGESAHAWGST